MFEVGDKILYPMHGAGIIQSLEEKEFLGEKHLYFVLSMLLKDLEIMVPIQKMSSLGIRHVVKRDILDDALDRLHDGETEPLTQSGQRQKMNTEKMKSGDIYKGCEVIRDLWALGKTRVLGTSDKLMLDSAQQILISEMELVLGVGTEQASLALKQVCSKNDAVSAQATK
jgi:CarD family transcriptional regulator